MIVWGVDTGVTRNASAAARCELLGVTWTVQTWEWQGSPGSPLSIEHTVAQGLADLWVFGGRGEIVADAYQIHELRRGLNDRFAGAPALPHLAQQSGELVKVYAPTRRLIHRETEQRLVIKRIGYVWTGEAWQEDPRAGERVLAGIKAVEREATGGKIVVRLPENGASHHDAAAAVMRGLWRGGAAPAKVPAVTESDEEMALRWLSPRAMQPVRQKPVRITEMFRHLRAR